MIRSVTKRLSNITLEDDFSISSVLSNVPTKALASLYLADNKGAEVKELKKNDLKKLVAPAITVSAAKYLVENLSLEQLQVAVAPLKIDHKKKHNNPNSKKVLTKRLNEYLMENGISAYLEEHAEVDLLKSICETFDLVAGSSKADLVKQITEAVETEGLRVYFGSFSEEVLRDVAFDMKLEKDPSSTTSKQVLLECILHNHEVPEREEKKKEKIKISKTKPEIKKGVPYQDIFQHYYVEELHDWCKKNGLKTSGAKSDLISRILAFLDGDKENTMAGQRKARRRKAAAKKPTKKTETKEAAPPKKAAPKPKEVEEQPEEEELEEDGEEDVELDLENLDQYSVAELKKYCEDEQLEVTGKGKAAYISAINAYNDGDEEEN